MGDDGFRRDSARGARAVARRRAGGRWNPHVIVLIGGGLVLVAMGVSLYRSALRVVYADFTSRRAEGIHESEAGQPGVADELVRMQVEWTVGPLLILFGIAAVLLGVVVLAVRWRRVDADGD